MKWVFFFVVMAACLLLGTAMVLIDHGVIRDSAICGVGALVGFLIAYQMQSRYTILDD
ncbi:hypothetical protein [Reinekea blandensis]|nr:hypothetical protein [Reinekea blandensis]